MARSLDIAAKADRGEEFTRQREFITGRTIGHKRTEVWRVRVLLGTNYYTSTKTYPSEANAKRAADRLMARLINGKG